jgi:hypothetical protein
MKPVRAKPNRRRLWWLSGLVVLFLIPLYFEWCPQFGHGGATDSEQVVFAALNSGAQTLPAHVFIVRDHALASWAMQSDQRTEMLFIKRMCRWSVVTSSDGFERATLREWGVSSGDANKLYTLLMEGYAEGP